MQKLFSIIKNSRFFINLSLFLAVMGPGIITASVGNNSAGIATYSLAGAHYGYSLVWSFIPMLIALILAQEMSARMAVATGKGLADLIRENFGVKITFYLMFLLFFVNLLCLIAEFSGLAASLEIFHISKYISIPISAFLVWMLVVKGTYKAVERTFLVLSSFYIAYIISGFIAHPDWSSAFKQTVLPSFDLNFQSSLMLIGMIGTTITPWMQFYLQSSVVEKRVGVENYKSLRLDVIIGCVVASVVAFFIVVACAATLFKENVSVQTVSDAALALRPLAGPYASFLFAFGLFNAAIFAVSILPLSTAYSICEGMGWEEGIDKNFKDAPQFFWLYTIMIAIGAGVVLIPNFPFLKMMYLSQVGNGILLPFILLFMLSLVNDEEIMGEFKNTPSLNVVTYIVVAVLILLTILMLTFSLPFFSRL